MFIKLYIGIFSSNWHFVRNGDECVDCRLNVRTRMPRFYIVGTSIVGKETLELTNDAETRRRTGVVCLKCPDTFDGGYDGLVDVDHIAYSLILCNCMNVDTCRIGYVYGIVIICGVLSTLFGAIVCYYSVFWFRVPFSRLTVSLVKMSTLSIFSTLRSSYFCAG